MQQPGRMVVSRSNFRRMGVEEAVLTVHSKQTHRAIHFYAGGRWPALMPAWVAYCCQRWPMSHLTQKQTDFTRCLTGLQGIHVMNRRPLNTTSEIFSMNSTDIITIYKNTRNAHTQQADRQLPRWWRSTCFNYTQLRMRTIERQR